MKNKTVLVFDLFNAKVKILIGCVYLSFGCNATHLLLFVFFKKGSSNCFTTKNIKLFVKLLVSKPFFLKIIVLKNLYVVESI